MDGDFPDAQGRSAQGAPQDRARDGEPKTAEGAKCKQILEGAREVFLARGFDAASMGEIARVAKVSKGTLYVYFESKEALFRALIDERKREAAERLFLAASTGAGIEAVLTGYAERFIDELTEPKHVALVRMVIGAADKFPDLGRTFYEAGPENGAGRLAERLESFAEKGELVLDDPKTAAWHFLGMCHQPAAARTIFAAAPKPDRETIAFYAAAAVKAFLRAYGPR